jgi:hypothetical protein
MGRSLAAGYNWSDKPSMGALVGNRYHLWILSDGECPIIHPM